MLEKQAIPGQWLTITRGLRTGETFCLSKGNIDLYSYRGSPTLPRYYYRGVWHTNFDLRVATAEEVTAAYSKYTLLEQDEEESE